MNEDIYHLGIKALMRDGDGNVLLLQVNPAKLNGERKDYWDLPGGRVQKGDTVPDTLNREVAEETGIANVLHAKQIGMVLSNIRIPLGENLSAGLILAVYACDVIDSSVIVLSDEHIAYEWFAVEEAARLLEIKYPKEFCTVIAEL